MDSGENILFYTKEEVQLYLQPKQIYVINGDPRVRVSYRPLSEVGGIVVHCIFQHTKVIDDHDSLQIQMTIEVVEKQAYQCIR